LYSGEQFDSKIGQQYLRARYYDPATGRFNRLDPFFGNLDDPQSLHKYLYTHADPVNMVDPNGLFGGVVGVGVGMAIGGNMQGNNARVQIGTYLRLKNTINSIQKTFEMIDRILDIIDYVEGAVDLLVGGPAIFMDVYNSMNQSSSTFMNALNIVKPGICVKTSIPLPESMVKWLQKKTAGVASINKIQEIIGTIATNFLARSVGFETISFKLGYKGIDAIYRFSGIGTYVIAESKGGTSKLSKGAKKGDQMYDKWIDNSIKTLARSQKNNQELMLRSSSLSVGDIVFFFENLYC
jgi:RHS repeat-associated protein